MRYTVESILSTADNLTIYDPTSIDWTKFDWSNGFYKYTLSKFDILKPYYVSYKFYGSVDYEDIILLLNGIADPFELQPGIEINVPKKEDIDSFILKYRK
jgi:hypothetical protein